MMGTISLAIARIGTTSTIMGKGQPFTHRDNPKKKILLWIDAIKDDKLLGPWAEGQSTEYDDFFRLDCQCVTTNAALRFNFQVQTNFEVPDTSLRNLALGTVA